MSFKNSSEARGAARGDAVRHGPVRREHAAGVPAAADDPLVGVLPRPKGSAARVAAADARAGADAGALRLSPSARADAAGGLDGGQGAVLPGVHGGRARA